MPAPLAILYEHPLWFEPLFASLQARGLPFEKIELAGHSFDPVAGRPPAPVILSRLAMSSFLREDDHPIHYGIALLDHWRRQGARVLNGPEVLAIDTSKARQLSLLRSLGLAVPETRAVHSPRDLVAAAQALSFPLLVKANIGGSGAGIARYSSIKELERSVAEKSVPQSIDKVLLLQDYVPARGGSILRIETLAGRYLYALEVESSGDSFDLCPADACIAQPGRSAVGMRAVTPPPAVIAAAERVAQAVGMDLGGVELVIDDRDGVPRFYDINGMSNYVANPLDVLGWDPHDRLVDYLEGIIEEEAAA